MKEIKINNKVKYSIDYTNSSDDYERNRQRKIILGMKPEEYQFLVKRIFNYNKANKDKLKKVTKYFIIEKFQIMILVFLKKYLMIYDLT